ncbi:MAG: hypothetical protein M0Z65_01360, partial [Firmicutes bacterium]|nr:hypothetical protein [Bacillota bacterium]
TTGWWTGHPPHVFYSVWWKCCGNLIVLRSNQLYGKQARTGVSSVERGNACFDLGRSGDNKILMCYYQTVLFS